MRRLALSYTLVAVLLCAARADAMPTAKLVYVRDEGAESCPDEDALRASVAARLGYNPFRVVADNTLFAEVRRGSPGFVADVKLIGEHGVMRGERHLTSASKDCQDISLAMALSMSIALDPLSLTRPAGTPPPDAAVDDALPVTIDPPKQEPPPPPPPRPESPPPSPPAAPGSRMSLAFGIGPSVAFGVSPSPMFGLTVMTEERWRYFSFEADAFIGLRASHSTDQGGSVETSLTSGSLAACGHVGPAFVCASGLLGQVVGEATDVTHPQSQNFLFAGVGPRAGVNIPIVQSVELRAMGEALYVLTPFELDLNNRAVYSSSPVLGTLTLGAAIHFP